MAHIVLVEDDAKLRKLLSSDLELEGYQVTAVGDGREGRDAVLRVKPDLAILDVMLPQMTGFEVCRAVRKEGFDGPILMLTARAQETDKVVGLDLGADDYVIKPIGTLELHARIRALLRRRCSKDEALDVERFGDIEIHFKKMQATRKGKQISLTAREYKILELLIRREGEVITRDAFLEQVWGYDVELTTRAVDNQILSLRQKLEAKDIRGKSHIQTVHGAGYKFTRTAE
jgi:DNA-binding response OmpR family regulator